MMQTSKAAAKTAAFLKQKKYRIQTGEFLVEGLRNVEEAVEYGNTKTIFFVPTDDERTNSLLQKAENKGIEISETYEGYMEQISDTTTPQGIIAICVMPKRQISDVFNNRDVVLVVDRVQDPGNLGTMLRTADAVGAGGVICLAGTVDLYSPKVVRSSMGALFHLPVLDNITEAEFLQGALVHHYETVVTTPEGDTSVYEVCSGGKKAIIMGNEANGVSQTLLESANYRVFVPMKGRAESLNVGIATAIVMFELSK